MPMKAQDEEPRAESAQLFAPEAVGALEIGRVQIWKIWQDVPGISPIQQPQIFGREDVARRERRSNHTP